jgi:hypothetical protein
MLEVVRWRSSHTDALHDPNRTTIGWICERNELWQVEAFKRVPKRRMLNRDYGDPPAISGPLET